jgi:hypothetical protein
METDLLVIEPEFEGKGFVPNATAQPLYERLHRLVVRQNFRLLLNAQTESGKACQRNSGLSSKLREAREKKALMADRFELRGIKPQQNTSTLPVKRRR